MNEASACWWRDGLSNRVAYSQYGVTVNYRVSGISVPGFSLRSDLAAQVIY